MAPIQRKLAGRPSIFHDPEGNRIEIKGPLRHESRTMSPVL